MQAVAYREPAEGFLELLEGTNINQQTLLATDYLNHFNEAVMLLELIPDMPEMLCDARQWRPKSYCDHFHDSDFRDKDLACEAYDQAPPRFKLPFDLTRKALDRRIGSAIAQADALVSTGSEIALRLRLEEDCAAIRELISVASGIINGCEVRADGAADRFAPPKSPEKVLAQNDIDALFD